MGAEFGRTRVGLHYGESVVGNFGGEGRLSYTALGDAMNCAARLEGANKYLKTIALVSDEARSRTSIDVFRPMGRIVLSGRATPIAVWEPAPDFDPQLRAELVRLWDAFDGGDPVEGRGGDARRPLQRHERVARGHLPRRVLGRDDHPGRW